MRQLDCFKEIEKKSYIVWCDTGTHFRCFEVLHYLFKELADLEIKVSLNYFCEKHGKNSRDQHFSLISHFLKEESMTKKLTSSQDICDAINKGQLRKNLQNERLSSLQKNTSKTIYKSIKTRSFVIPQHENEVRISQLIIKDLRSRYNYFTDDTFLLKTNLMSDQNCCETLKDVKIKHFFQRYDFQNKIDKIEPIIVKKKYLNKKMMKWRISQRRLTDSINNSQVSSDNRYTQNFLTYSSDELIQSKSLDSTLTHCSNKCQECSAVCKYRLSDINQYNENLTHIEINDELKKHGHPKSRRTKIRGRTVARTITEAKLELKKHYTTCHLIN